MRGVLVFVVLGISDRLAVALAAARPDQPAGD
jgi:hypothetical protein